MDRGNKEEIFFTKNQNQESSTAESRRFLTRQEIGKTAVSGSEKRHQRKSLAEKLGLISVLAIVTFFNFVPTNDASGGKHSLLRELKIEQNEIIDDPEIFIAKAEQTKPESSLVKNFKKKVEQGKLKCEYIKLGGEEAGCLEANHYSVFIREVFIEPPAKGAKMPEVEKYLWLPTSGYVDLDSNNPDKISYRIIPDNYESFDFVEVNVKNPDKKGEFLQTAAVYGGSIISDNPRPTAEFVWDDGTKFNLDDFITDFDDYPPGTDEGMDMIREIVEKSESIFDILSVVNTLDESPLTGKRFKDPNTENDTKISYSTQHNSKDIQIIKSLEADCTGRIILACSLLKKYFWEKYQYDAEISLVTNCTDRKDAKYNRTITHIELQIKTDDGRYVCFDPNTSSQFGFLTSDMFIDFQAPLDNLRNDKFYNEMCAISGVQFNMNVDFGVRSDVDFYASRIKSPDDKIKFRKK